MVVRTLLMSPKGPRFSLGLFPDPGLSITLVKDGTTFCHSAPGSKAIALKLCKYLKVMKLYCKSYKTVIVSKAFVY